MPCLDSREFLPNSHIVFTDDVNRIAKVELDYRPCCPHCHGTALRNKDKKVRKFKACTGPFRYYSLQVVVHKFLCRTCNRYFMEQIQGVLRYQRQCECFKTDLCTLMLRRVSRKDLSQATGIGSSTMERWLHRHFDLKFRERQNRPCPEIMGIDEHFFSKKKGFATTMVDIKNHSVFDIVLGRSENALNGYLSRLKGRDHVRLVMMDLSDTYRSIVKRYFPHAQIVADRFHLIRIVQLAFYKTWQRLDPNSKYNRGLISLMRRHHWNLTPEQTTNLQSYLDRIPGLRPVYEFKQALCRLLTWKSLNQSAGKRVVAELLAMIRDLQESSFDLLRTLGNTMSSWIEEIGRMLRYGRTNAMTEGFHNRMEVISRDAYGFRNFNNYKLRVMVLCG
ncbi:MAG: ISL3 family transposase [Bacteriovoracaceae bacterium]|nr:ISL3 family transposase [Bacteriovoracaceae bacterium]